MRLVPLISLALLTACNNAGVEKDAAPAPAQLVTAGYADDASCARCHSEIAEQFSHMGMGRSFAVPDPQTAVEDFTRGEYYHEASDLYYRMTMGADGVMRMTQYEVADDGQPINDLTLTCDFAVGSGNHARTYLHRTASGELWEMPVSWYSEGEGHFGMSPGYDHASHQRVSRMVGYECMFCHNAYPDVLAGNDRDGMPQWFPQTMPSGIGCQRCHGPGQAHVDLAYDAVAGDEAIAAAILNPIDLPADRRDDVCLQCHLQPFSQHKSLVRRDGRGYFSYQPNESLTQYLAHVELETPQERGDAFEVNHHAWRLRQSACFTQSGGLDCLACHDPHGQPAPEDRVAFYAARCQECHAVEDCTVVLAPDDPHASMADCAGCHMPRRRPSDAIHAIVTDHRIGIYDDGVDLIAALSDGPPHPVQGADLVLGDRFVDDSHASLYPLAARIVSDDLSAVDPLAEAMAGIGEDVPDLRTILAQGLERVGRGDEALLEYDRVAAADPARVDARINAAVQHAARRELDQAVAELTALVEERGELVDARVRLAILLEASGERASALGHVRVAAELRPTDAAIAAHLARLLVITGDIAGSLDAWQTAAALNPGDPQVTRNLGAALWAGMHRDEAIRTWLHGLRRAPDSPQLREQVAMAVLLFPPDESWTPLRGLAEAELAVELGGARQSTLAVAIGTQLSGFPRRECDEAVRMARELGADPAALELLTVMRLVDLGRVDEASALLERVETALARHVPLSMVREGLIQAARRYVGR